MKVKFTPQDHETIYRELQTKLMAALADIESKELPVNSPIIIKAEFKFSFNSILFQVTRV